MVQPFVNLFCVECWLWQEPVRSWQSNCIFCSAWGNTWRREENAVRNVDTTAALSIQNQHWFLKKRFTHGWCSSLAITFWSLFPKAGYHYRSLHHPLISFHWLWRHDMGTAPMFPVLSLVTLSSLISITSGHGEYRRMHRPHAHKVAQSVKLVENLK